MKHHLIKVNYLPVVCDDILVILYFVGEKCVEAPPSTYSKTICVKFTVIVLDLRICSGDPILVSSELVEIFYKLLSLSKLNAKNNINLG